LFSRPQLFPATLLVVVASGMPSNGQWGNSPGANEGGTMVDAVVIAMIVIAAVDDDPPAFKPDGVYSGIAFKVRDGGEIEAMLADGPAAFRDFNQFIESVKAKSILPSDNSILHPARHEPDGAAQ
jgi:hypothetical protein